MAPDTPATLHHTCSASHGQRVNGVRVDLTTSVGLVRAVERMMTCGRSHVVHFVSADPTVRARRAPQYREVLNRGDLNVADGMSVVWALRLKGHQTERITGSDAVELLAGMESHRSVRHFLYGGTSVALEMLRDRLSRSFPMIEIVGAEAPSFGPLGDADLVEAAQRIRASRADLLWVGLGTPKQDVVAERLRELNAAPVILCVGAAFDFLGGAKQRAPVWMQRTGLEWAHRLATEPRRLWKRYLVGNPHFVVGLVRDELRGRLHSRRNLNGQHVP